MPPLRVREACRAPHWTRQNGEDSSPTSSCRAYSDPVSVRQPGYLLEVRGFASPARGGFAFPQRLCAHVTSFRRTRRKTLAVGAGATAHQLRALIPDGDRSKDVSQSTDLGAARTVGEPRGRGNAWCLRWGSFLARGEPSYTIQANAPRNPTIDYAEPLAITCALLPRYGPSWPSHLGCAYRRSSRPIL